MDELICKDIQNKQYELMSEETTGLLVKLLLTKGNDEALEAIKAFANHMYESPTVAAIIYKRYQVFKESKNLPEIDDSVFLIGDAFSGGNPGRGVLFLIDILGNYHTKDKITLDNIINLYPEGYYNFETCQNIVDNYVKTGLLKFSELY